jgi:hypothetical protein
VRRPEVSQSVRNIIADQTLTGSVTSLAWVEMYIGAVAIIQRLDLDIFDTVRARDVDFTRDCLVGQSVKGSKGVRVKHLAK